MKKSAIFDDVVSIMQQDSATKKDKTGADPVPFRQRITDDMAEEDFLYQVQTYLASFGVIGHISFRRKDTPPKGFRLRSTSQGLFVEDANADTNLRVGDQIVAIGDLSLKTMQSHHVDYFVSSTPERQYREWGDLILQVGQVTILRDGQRLALTVQASREQLPSRFEWKQLDDGIVYLRLDDFMNEQAVTALYEESREAIQTAQALVIDVRHNAGGTDSLYLPLLHYALSEGATYADLDWQDDGMEILYTDRNVDLRLESFDQGQQQEGISQETLDLLAQMRQELLSNRGKGYVVFESEDTSFFPDVVGQSSPERIFVLTDVYCGSSGDNFVQTMKQFPKVTVVGRPTLGILDYSNCCQVDYGDYLLNFPTSRSLALDHGEGMTDCGVQPHVLIPWTPEHLERDVDVEYCLEMMNTH